MQEVRLQAFEAVFENECAPFSYAESYDNPGLLLGRHEQIIQTVMVAVDASESVIQQAVEAKADLLITHHPLIFHPLRRLVDSERNGRRLLQLMENGIALYSAHTNMDSAPGGNNDRACEQLGLLHVQAVGEPGEIASLRIGQLPEPLCLSSLAALVKERFALPTVRMVGSAEQKVHSVALCTGSGMDFMEQALKAGADVLITGDITYHKADDAQAAGLCLIDATHFGTDRLSVAWLCQRLGDWAQKNQFALRVIAAQEQDLYQVV